MDRIRILHFARIVNRSDFIDTVLARLDRSLFDVRALVGLPAKRSGGYPPGAAYPIRILGFSFDYVNLVRMFLALASEIRAFRPHVVHAHHFNENVVASLALRSKMRPAYVIGHHYSDHIYFLTRGLKRRVLLGAEAFCNHRADRILVPTRTVAALLTERQGVPATKVTTIPYALELDLLRPTSPEAVTRIRSAEGLQRSYVILSPCRLSAEKGLDHLLVAMPRIRAMNAAVRLVLLGSGPCERELRQRAVALGVGDIVRFAGWRDDALDWIAAADVVVQPSECESYCQVLIEALVLGTPVVMTPVGVAPEVMADSRGGSLVPVRDSDAIAEAVGELMATPGLGSRLAEAGRAYVLEHMDAARITREHEDIYASLGGRRGREGQTRAAS
jgi:glycosyltransferase involved in cell wall biosynthesis